MGEEISTQHVQPAAAPVLLASELIRSSLFVEAVAQNKIFHKAVTRAVIDPFSCMGPWKALSWEVES